MLSLSKPSANCNLFASGESLKYCFTKMWHRDTNWPNAVGNVEKKDLLGAALQKPLISKKKKKKNAISMTCSKMRRACTYINILIRQSRL